MSVRVRAISSLAFWLSRGLRYAARQLDRLDGPSARLGRHEQAVKGVAASHDMVAHPDEAYYAHQYLYWILAECQRRFPRCDPAIVDIGSGQGRITFPLAAWAAEGTVVGVDFTPEAVEAARAHANRGGHTNVRFHEADAREFLARAPDATFDVAVMLEVAFILPNYGEVLREAVRVLKPGGILIASFRSLYFDLLLTVRQRHWTAAEQLVEAREGYLGNGTVWFSWHTAGDVRAILDSLGLKGVRLCGVGICSGIEGDPLAPVAQPSQLTDAERKRLLGLEIALAERYADCGRYILAVGEKPRAGL